MRSIHIKASREYDVLVERGLLDRAGELLREVSAPGMAAIVSDDTVYALYGERTVKALKTALTQVVAHTGEVFGNSQVECGNFRTLSLKAAQDECASYLKVLEDWSVDKLAYPKGDTK